MVGRRKGGAGVNKSSVDKRPSVFTTANHGPRSPARGARLVSVITGLTAEVPSVWYAMVPFAEYRAFMRIHRETKGKAWRGADEIDEGNLKELVVKKSSVDSTLYSVGPWPASYYHADAFKDVPTIGRMLNVRGCEWPDKSVSVERLLPPGTSVAGLITIVALVTDDTEGVFSA